MSDQILVVVIVAGPLLAIVVACVSAVMIGERRGRSKREDPRG